jgi:membrane protein DedA with SNARE-associated domain
LEKFVEQLIVDYGTLIYLITVVWTFLEGETFVIILGVLASEGRYQINIHMLMLAATLGSFAGDQFYFYVGRRYGTPLLDRWPQMRDKIDWTFRMVRDHETLFILSFRFIYGIRNISPFVIGMSGISRLKYFFLNLIAATIWAGTFSWGGYLLGTALEQWLGSHKWLILGGFVAFIALLVLLSKLKERRKAAAAKAATTGEG